MLYVFDKVQNNINNENDGKLSMIKQYIEILSIEMLENLDFMLSSNFLFDNEKLLRSTEDTLDKVLKQDNYNIENTKRSLKIIVSLQSLYNEMNKCD